MIMELVANRRTSVTIRWGGGFKLNEESTFYTRPGTINMVVGIRGNAVESQVKSCREKLVNWRVWWTLCSSFLRDLKWAADGKTPRASHDSSGTQIHSSWLSSPSAYCFQKGWTWGSYWWRTSCGCFPACAGRRRTRVFCGHISHDCCIESHCRTGQQTSR